MKTKLFLKILSQFLFLSLILIISVKKAFGSESSGWEYPDTFTAGLPVSMDEQVFNFLKSFAFAPLLAIGLLFYSIYFYKRIRKKDKEKRKKLIKIGTVIIAIDVLIYIVYIAIF